MATDHRKMALDRKIAAAEAAGDSEAAEAYRARLGQTGADAGTDDGAVDYEADGWSKDELQAEAEKRGLTVEGSGANGNVVKADLIAALQKNDAEGAGG